MKKSLVLLLISFIHHINIVLAQTQKLWESNITTAEANSDYPNEARKCVVDVDGNLYVLGHFNGNLTISGTTLSGVNGDICLMKYDK